MTTEEKRIKLCALCSDYDRCQDGCPLFDDSETDCDFMDDGFANAAYDIAFPSVSDETFCIKDSGERHVFSTGAIRDIQKGRGRCDLLPLDVVGHLMYDDSLVFQIYEFTNDGDPEHLITALEIASNGNGYPWLKFTDMLLEVSIQFEGGAEKYEENNWQKGIPTHCYIDSAVRHYLKWLRGDTDEPHDRAFVWNILCCIWTCKHKPEMNDYGKDDE